MNELLMALEAICNTSQDINLEMHKKVVSDYITEHKKIEQEIGIELSVLFKAMKQGGVYKKGKNIFNTLFLPTIPYNPHKKYLICVNNIDDHETELKLTDYGKTWALTKEELEK